jgi:hypothetical protein
MNAVATLVRTISSHAWPTTAGTSCRWLLTNMLLLLLLLLLLRLLLGKLLCIH